MWTGILGGVLALLVATQMVETKACSPTPDHRGQRFPRFANNMFVATLRGSHLLRLGIDPVARRVTSQERLLDGNFGRLRDVISGPDGYLYFSTSNRDGRGGVSSTDDRIARLVPAS